MMINGLKFQMSADELSEYLFGRINHHVERRAFYQTTLDNFNAGAGGDAPPQFTNGDPRQGLQAKVSEHDSRVKMFTFLRNHLVTGETYQLDESDLSKIEILPRHW